MILSDDDIKQITNHGLAVQEVTRQIADFARGFPFADIVRPATVTDGGIQEMNYATRKEYIDTYQNYAKTHTVVKFVPASGAATRMLRDLFSFLESAELNDTARRVCEHARMLAFYDELKLGENATNTDIARATVQIPKRTSCWHRYNALCRI